MVRALLGTTQTKPLGTGPTKPLGTAQTRRRIDRSLLVVSMAIAVGLVMIGWAVVSGVTGDEAKDLPEAIEDISPAPDAVQVLAQTSVVVDLAEGFEGELIVDDIAFPTRRMEDLTSDDVEPGEQVEIPAGVVFEPGNDTLTFTPGAGIEIEKFDDGLHQVRVIYWTVEDGDDDARSYNWTFNVV